MFDNIPIADKQLKWIHGTTRRWDGYLEFQRRPVPRPSDRPPGHWARS
jgi:uncharacterized protein